MGGYDDLVEVKVTAIVEQELDAAAGLASDA